MERDVPARVRLVVRRAQRHRAPSRSWRRARRSPSFRDRRRRVDLYEPLVANALTFYLGQRDGADVDPSVLDRKPSHLHDRNAKVVRGARLPGERLQRDLTQVGGPVDVEGGWFDAGDYVKFTGTTSFAVTLMLVGGARPPVAVRRRRWPDFEAEAERGVRWLLKMVDAPRRSSTTRWGSAAAGAGILADHDVWRLPAEGRRLDPTRPSLPRASPRPAGRRLPARRCRRRSPAGWPSVFGLCAQLWAGTPLATRCLHEGQVVFSMAKTNDVGTQITSSPIGLLPGGRMARRPGDGRHPAVPGAVATRGTGPEPPVSTPRYYLKRAASLGRRRTGIRRSTAVTRSTCTTSPGSPIAELHRAIEADGGAGLKVTPADLLADLRDQLDPRSKKAGR